MSTTLLAPTMSQTLAAKIKSRSARVGVIGLGYVGCPLAVEFAKAGFTVTGIDLLESKVAGINAGRSHIQDVPEAQIRAFVEAKNCRHDGLLGDPRTGHDQHLRPHAAAQDQRPGHELHRGRVPGDQPIYFIPAC